MFDLFRSRDKAVRILLGALLLLVAMSMLTYLVPSYNTGSNSSDSIVAEIGKDRVTQLDVQRQVQNTMRGRQIPAEILPNYVPQMITQLITDRALAYEAERLGYDVTDAQLRDAIQMYIPSLFQDGKFVGRDTYAAMLGQQNLSIAEFEADMRRQVLIGRLRGVAVEGTVVTPADIEKEYRQRNEKLKIQYVLVSQDKYKAEVQPTAEEMQTYFKTNAARYTMPEKKNLAILIADQAKIEQTVNPALPDLQRMYTQNLDSFRTPEQVKVRHILLMTQGKPPADDAKIKAQAEDLLKQVRAGANFADLVKKYSEDPGSKTNNGEYTVQKNGQMVKEFEDASFRLKPGESDLIKTTYGYHVVQVMQHDQPRVKPFEEVAGELAVQWKKQRVNDLMQQISDKASQALQKDPAHPERVAAEFNMQLVRADGVEPGKPVPEVGASPDFDQAIAQLKKGEASPPVALAGNKLAVGELLDIVPSRPATFEEVQSQVKDTMVQNRLTAAVQKHAQELLDKAKADGDLEKAAKSMGLEVKTPDEFTRAGSIEKVGPASYVAEGFTKPVGTILGPIATPDATVVAKVLAHVDPDMSKLPEQRASIRDEIKSRRARDRDTLFEAGIRDQLIKEGKIKIHQDVVNRIIAGYRPS